VAIAVAEALSGSYVDGVWFVGLASLADPELVPSAVSATLGVSPSGTNPISGLTAWLRDKHALIVLDSCEHVIGAAAALAEAALRAAPRVHILATSREPLRAEGEWLRRLAALETPPAAVDLTASEAMRYSAVQLFEDRARATVDGFTFSMRMRRRFWRFAAGSMASRWRLNWQLPASTASGYMNLPLILKIASAS
jgi:predicted ATPase